MKKGEDFKLELGKTVFNHESVLYSQIYRICDWIPLTDSADEIKRVEKVLRMIKSLIRPDKEYFARLSLLNDEYDRKLNKLKEADNIKDKEQIELIYQEDFAFEHFDILMELANRKGHLSFLPKGTIVFGDLMAIDKSNEKQIK